MGEKIWGNTRVNKDMQSPVTDQNIRCQSDQGDMPQLVVYYLEHVQQNTPHILTLITYRAPQRVIGNSFVFVGRDWGNGPISTWILLQGNSSASSVFEGHAGLHQKSQHMGMHGFGCI